MVTVLYYLIYLLQGITAGLFMHLCLTPKRSRWICWMAWGIAAIWQPLGRVVQMMNEDMKSLVVLSGFGLFMVIVFFLYEDVAWKKITVVFLTFVATLFADCIVLLAFYFGNPSYLDVATEINIQTTIIGVAGEAGIIVVYLIMLFIWQMLNNHVLIKGYLPTLLLPISQLCFSVGANLRPRGDSASYSIAFFIGEIAGFVLDIYWMGELLFRSRRAEAQQELREMEHARELEQTHYAQIESKREEVARIRHDINNQIAAAKRLVRDGKMEVASDMLDQLSTSLLATKEYEYCQIPLINAVLAEKKRVCEAESIALEVNLNLPDEAAIENTELCSLFSNLLDNAIRATSQMEMPERKIKISSLCEGGMLVIKTENPSEKPGKIRPGHGKGSLILKSIAEKYDGDYRGEYKDGVYTAMVNLMVGTK